MAERKDSSKSEDENVIDFDFEKEFEFNPSEWMVVDDDDEEENDKNENAVGDSKSEKNIEKVKVCDDRTKQTGGKSQVKKSTSASKPNTRTNSSDVQSSREGDASEILCGKVKHSEMKRTSKSPAKERKATGKHPVSKPTGISNQTSNRSSQQKSCTQASGKSNTRRSIADVFEKSSVQLQSGKSTKESTAIPASSTNTKTTSKRKAEDNLKSPPSTKVAKHASNERSQERSPSTRGASRNSTECTGNGSNQRISRQTTPIKLLPKPGMVEAQVGSTKTGGSHVDDKKRPAGNDTLMAQHNMSAGGSIAEAMGVKVSENTKTDVVAVDDKDDILPSTADKKSGVVKSSVEGAVSNKHNKADLKSAARTTSAVSTSLQDSTKGGISAPSSNNASTVTPGASKKRIVRRFHRTTQTFTPEVSSKLVQCLIKIPSLDLPRKPDSCDIGLMIDKFASLEKVSSTSSVLAVTKNTVTLDVLKEALGFGVAEDDASSRKIIKDRTQHGIRICQILAHDADKANYNIKKADDYVLSSSTKNASTLDLFYDEEDGLVQVYNYLRKNRVGPRHNCITIFIPGTVPNKKDKTIPEITATITFDQNSANSTYVAYSKAPAWNKPKADVVLSVHNVPKDVPMSLFSFIFPDAVSVEMDDPLLKVTEDASNRIKLGMPRKSVDRFLSLFPQVIVNNTLLVITSGLTQEEDVPEMKDILLERKKMADQAEVDKKTYSVLTGVPRDINAKKKKNLAAQPETDVIMHVENVDSIERILSSRTGPWRGPSTTDSLHQLKDPLPNAQKFRPNASFTTREELSDISDDSDFGEELPKKKIAKTLVTQTGATGSPDVLNRWRQTQPLNASRMERQVRDPPRRDSLRCNDSDERFVDLTRQDQPPRQKPFSNRDETDRDRETNSRQMGRHREERPPADGIKKWPDLNDADFDKRHKVIVAGQQRGRESNEEEDLRCMLETLKNRRSSKASDRMDSNSVTRSVEFDARSQSPKQGSRPRHIRGDHSRSPGRPEWDRRVVSRKSVSPPTARGNRDRIPSPSRQRQRGSGERDRQNFRRSSLSPSGKRDRLRSPSPLARRSNRRDPSLPFRPQHHRSRSRERVLKRSLSPILPFRPAQRSNKDSKDKEKRESQKQQQQSDSMRFRKSPSDVNKQPFNDQKRDSRVKEDHGRVGPTGGDSEIAMSKTLYNTLMERLREKAEGYEESKDSNLVNAANVYSQINHLAETLTAIKNDESAVNRFGSGLDSIDAFVQKTTAINKNSNSSANDPSKDLHPDLLRYVNVRPGNGGTAADAPSSSMVPPPIPPPVAPPLFTSNSPSDKKAQLEAIAKQLVSDLKRQGPMMFDSSSSSTSTTTTTNTNPPSDVGRVEGSEGSLSGGMWMAPPPHSHSSSMVPPPVRPGGLFSVPPPPIIPNMMAAAPLQHPGPMPPIPPMNMNMMNINNTPGSYNSPPGFLPRGVGGNQNNLNNNNNACRQS